MNKKNKEKTSNRNGKKNCKHPVCIINEDGDYKCSKCGKQV